MELEETWKGMLEGMLEGMGKGCGMDVEWMLKGWGMVRVVHVEEYGVDVQVSYST